MTSIVGWLYRVAVDGVDHSLEGNGGPDCVNFIPIWQRILETLVFLPLSVYVAYIAWPYLEWPSFSGQKNVPPPQPPLPTPDNVVDVAVDPIPGADRQLSLYRKIYACVFAIELTYKYVSRTAIFLLNPCHIATSFQLFLLSMDSSDRRVTQLFRFQLYLMPGAIFALLFPILNTRILPGEIITYFLQHVFIVTTPLYMMAQGGNFQPESYHNVAWPAFAMSIIVIYHFVILQGAALYTSVNLNCILCPAVSDPLHNRFWRIAAFGHQCALVPILAKYYVSIGTSWLRQQQQRLQQLEMLETEAKKCD